MEKWENWKQVLDMCSDWLVWLWAMQEVEMEGDVELLPKNTIFCGYTEMTSG